jgi:hypothetical protein
MWEEEVRSETSNRLSRTVFVKVALSVARLRRKKSMCPTAEFVSVGVHPASCSWAASSAKLK